MDREEWTMENVMTEPLAFQASAPDYGDALFERINASGVIKFLEPVHSDGQVYGGERAVSA